jgi:hypothetical protein
MNRRIPVGLALAPMVLACLVNPGCGKSTSLQTKPDASLADQLSIIAISGTPQSATAGASFAAALQARVLDGASHPVGGVAIAFTAPSTGAGATFAGATAAAVLTDASGVGATPVPRANGVVGTYDVLASIPGAAPAVFTLTNSPAPAADTNLALGKPATQVSLFSDANPDASVAVDGNTDGNFLHGSVSHTVSVANAWWQVDLGAMTAVSQIVIWNRTDFRVDRLNDYWVFLSDVPFLATDTPATLQGRAGTFGSHQTTTPMPTQTIAGGGAQGRYVRVQLAGTNYLSLAEVQVLSSAGVNVAQGQPASQSGTFLAKPSVAGLAVDGNTDGILDDCSVAHTDAGPNPWWQVDLGGSFIVSSIVIWNRTDCCGDRLGDYWLFLSDTPFTATEVPATLQARVATWSSHQTIAPNPSGTIAVGGAQGRYVRVQLSGTNYLNLAEVQVMGH